MYQGLLSDPRLYACLLKVDEELATAARDVGCPCGGVLHRADYSRKPRGGPAGSAQRFSFCCAKEGCRQRATPPSVRFLGRRVYLGVVVVLAAAMRQGPTPQRVAWIREHLGVGARTLMRWRKWWRDEFVTTPFWKAARSRLLPSTEACEIPPRSLLERFMAGHEAVEGMVNCLKFLSPVTARRCSVSPAF